MEGIRICQRGYPNRVRFEEFISRYRLLSSKSQDSQKRKFNEDHKTIVKNLCIDLELDEDRFQVFIDFIHAFLRVICFFFKIKASQVFYTKFLKISGYTTESFGLAIRVDKNF